MDTPLEETWSEAQRAALLHTLKTRFERHPARHPGLSWAQVQARLEAQPDSLRALHGMEITGGEPDVVGVDAATGAVLFFDCCAETPTGRRNLCYDRPAREGRKKFPPESSAVEMAESLGITLLSEAEYAHLQSLGEFDTKTSSWLLTPPEVRKLGGALFGDRRYGRVFVYHNGADSYYGVRGFRGWLKV